MIEIGNELFLLLTCVVILECMRVDYDEKSVTIINFTVIVILAALILFNIGIIIY